MKTVEEYILGIENDLKHYAMYLGIKGDDIDDIIQDTYLKILENKDKIRVGDPDFLFLPYALRTLKNTYLNRIRYMSYRDYEDIDTENLSIPGEAREDEDLGAREILRDIEAILGSGDSFQALLLLSQGYSYEEIADILGIRLGTLKSMIHRSREKIRRALRLSPKDPD